jgi:hypothetical protein
MEQENVQLKKKVFASPFWLIWLLVLPQSILYFINFRIFILIKSYLEPKDMTAWVIAAIVFLLFIIGFTIYAVIRIIQKKESHFIIVPLILILYITFYYVYFYNYQLFFPFRIPAWLLPSSDVFIYNAIFALPILGYSILFAVEHFTDIERCKIWPNILISVLIPALWYLIVVVLERFLFHLKGEIFTHLGVSFFIISIISFFFFLVRFFYILVAKKNEFLMKYSFIWKIIFALVFPVAGLILNSGIAGNHIFKQYDAVNFFGNFENISFLIIALANGILLSLPEFKNKILKLFLFYLKCLTYSFTLYFFIIFIPFYPFSIFAIFALGLGFLLISPLLLMLVHTFDLKNNFIILKNEFGKKKVIPAFVLCLVFPLLILINFNIEKLNFDMALKYTFQSSPSETKVNFSLSMLKNSIENIKNEKNISRFSITNGTPLITPLYKQIVFENLTLSTEKIRNLEIMYFGSSEYNLSKESNLPGSKNVVIKDIKVNSTYNEKEKLYHSTVDLELQNGNINNQEYLTYFNLPDGAFITDYYLYAGDVKKKGLLAEKKSVLWIYNEIKNERRDPGILYYTGRNTLSLKVYPFFAYEKRLSGFEITHLAPFSFKIDGRQVFLGDKKVINEPIFSSDKKTVYIPENVKEKLQVVERKKFYYFIVDCSLAAGKSLQNNVNKIEQFITLNPEAVSNSIVYAVNFEIKEIPLIGNWKNELGKIKYQGGFALDRAVKNILFKEFKNQTEKHPVIITVGDKMSAAIYNNDFKFYSFMIPENKNYFELLPDGNLRTHFMEKKPVFDNSGDIIKKIPQVKVKTWISDSGKIFYLKNDNESQIIKQNLDFNKNTSGNKFDTFLNISKLYDKYLFEPENTESIFKKLFIESLK